MNPGTTPRARIALSLTLPLLLIAGITFLRSEPVVEKSTIDAPQFLTWSGDPYEDGLNHFIVRTAASEIGSDGLFRRDADGLLSVDGDAIGLEVTVEELDRLISGTRTGTPIGESDTFTLVQAADGVAQVRAIGFGLLAVAGTIGAAELAAIPGVTSVDVDAALTAATVDEYYPSQWALENDGASPENWTLSPDADIDAPEAWHRTRGAGVVVAVIDSGVDVDHPDLAANIWHNTAETCGNGIDDDANGYIDDCDGWDFASQDPEVDDLNGHGTHVAGIIAAQANNGIGISGVAYESNVMVLKIGDQTPALSAAIEAIAYAINNGARVINASWVLDDPTAAGYLAPALDAIESAGMLLVTGAGNDGTNIDVHPLFPASSDNPAVLTVGASTAADLPAPYSGYGSASVDVFAPGEHIVSTVPGGGFGTYSGTSMASPMVAGAAALLWAATPAATAAEVKGALLDRSDGPNDGVTTFRGLATSDGRLNIERSIYTRLFRPSLMFTFHDFNSFEPGELHPVEIQAQTIDPWIAHPQTPSQYRAGLYVPLNGRPMAVTGYEIGHTTNGAAATTLTDASGQALIGDVFEPQQRSQLVQSGDFTTIRLRLPAGTYAFVMEIVDVTDASAPTRQGDPSAVFFTVGIDGSVLEMPGTPIGSGRGGGGGGVPTTVAGDGPSATTTTSAQVSTTTPVGGDLPTTTGGTGPATTTTSSTSAPDSGGATSTTTTVPSDDATTTTSTTSTTSAPSGGVETTTTMSTSPPDRGGTATTTTSAPGDGGATSTTGAPTTTLAPVGMRITDVDPVSGPTSGGTLVTITGAELPSNPIVWFGDQRADVVVVAAPTFIVVDAPTNPAGAVDVRVVDSDTGDEAVYSSGFLYTDDSGRPSTTLATTTTAAPDTTTSPTTTVTATPVDPDSDVTLDEWLNGALVTPEGLNLAPVAADNPIASIPVFGWLGVLCDEAVCPGWVIES